MDDELPLSALATPKKSSPSRLDTDMPLASFASPGSGMKRARSRSFASPGIDIYEALDMAFDAAMGTQHDGPKETQTNKDKEVCVICRWACTQHGFSQKADEAAAKETADEEAARLAKEKVEKDAAEKAEKDKVEKAKKKADAKKEKKAEKEKKKAKKEKKERKANQEKMKMCVICRGDEKAKHFHRLTDGCAHAAGCCSTCVRRHIETEINSKGDLSVKCPECRKELDHATVQARAATKDFQQYDKLLLSKMLSSLPSFRWCKSSCCGSGQEHASGDTAPIMRCHACQKRSCFTHDVPWHEGRTCKDYDDLLAQDCSEIANEEYKRRMTKPCPQCKTSIEKSSGCDHMTCSKSSGGCGHEFCWRCLADYEPIMRKGNHRHMRTCTYWSNYLSESEDEE